MKLISEEFSTIEYLGHVRNGVVILDTSTLLADGQVVRIEPLKQEPTTPKVDDQTERLNRMVTLFRQWDEEDRFLPDEEADRLQKALENNRRLSFHSNEVQ
jgi:hypothetical protein